MKRYETVTYAAVECKEGTFVRYSDHEAALAAAVAAEREACAELCETDYYTENGWGITGADLRCAKAIRARGAAHD
jgi:hypothetical protein